MPQSPISAHLTRIIPFVNCTGFLNEPVFILLYSQVSPLSSEYLIGENHLAIGNFAGLPSLTLPSGFVSEMPVGINVMGKAFAEQEVLNISCGLESLLGFKNQIAKVGE